jgi:hypothetical protein
MSTDVAAVPAKEAFVKRVLRAVGEFVFLTESERAAKILGKSRVELEPMQQAALRQLDASMLLWSAALRVEALAHFELARVECEKIAEAFPTLRAAMGDLAALKIDAGSAQSATEVSESVRSVFDQRWEKLASTVRWLGRVAMRPSGRMLTRGMRIFWTAATLLLFFKVILPRINPAKPTARASGEWSQLYKVQHVLDNDLATNWLLPDATLGWVEVTVPSRSVSTVKVWNVQGMVYYNTLTARIDLYEGTRVVHTQDVAMDAFAHSNLPYVMHLPREITADRVRVSVLSYTLYGGGFAQIVVE